MKKILYLFSFIALISFSSCTEGADYETYGGKGLEFVHFANTSVSQVVQLTTGTVYVTVGITILSDEDRTFPVSVDTEKSTAVAGRDYNLLQSSVTIPAGEYTATVAVQTLYDTMEQDESVSLVLLLDTDLLSPIYGNSMTLTMLYGVEINMDYLVGNWSEIDYTTDGTEIGDWVVQITQKSDNEIYLYNIWGGEETIEATIDFSADPVSMTIPAGSVIYNHATYGDTWMADYNGDTNPIACTIDAFGIHFGGWRPQVSAGSFAVYTETLLTKN